MKAWTSHEDTLPQIAIEWKCVWEPLKWVSGVHGGRRPRMLSRASCLLTLAW